MHSRDANRWGHYLVFFVCVPLAFAAWAAAIGMAPTPLLGLGVGFVYIATQVLAAWWINGLVAGWLAGLLRDYRPRLWQVLLGAFWIAWAPLVLFYYGQASFFASLFPKLAADAAVQTFSWDYVQELLRYSLPFLPLWIAAVYGYGRITGIWWFDSSEVRRTPVGKASDPDDAGNAELPVFLKRSKLTTDSKLLAVKAEEHYIHIYSQNESDMVRYRFGDALDQLDHGSGAQVHRSWWVCWDAVNQCRRKGKSLQLTLTNGLKVPVSLAHKAEVLDAVKRRSA